MIKIKFIRLNENNDVVMTLDEFNKLLEEVRDDARNTLLDSLDIDSVDELYEEGYEDGYNEAYDELEEKLSNSFDEGYEEGFNDALEELPEEERECSCSKEDEFTTLVKWLENVLDDIKNESK